MSIRMPKHKFETTTLTDSYTRFLAYAGLSVKKLILIKTHLDGIFSLRMPDNLGI